MKGLAGNQVHSLLVSMGFVYPSFEQVIAAGQIFQAISPIRAGACKNRCVQHEDETSHVLMNFAVQLYQTWFIENLNWWRVIFAVTTEIKPLGLRVRKYIMVEAIIV